MVKFMNFIQGGDVIQESIEANVTENTVLLEFQTSDGTLINQLIDFANVSFFFWTDK